MWVSYKLKSFSEGAKDPHPHGWHLHPRLIVFLIVMPSTRTLKMAFVYKHADHEYTLHCSSEQNMWIYRPASKITNRSKSEVERYF